MKVILLLKRNAALSHGAFRGSLQAQAGALIAPFARSVSRYQHNYPDIAAWCSPPDMAEAPYDAIVQLWFADRAGFEQLKTLCGDAALRAAEWPAIAPLIDPDRTMCFEVAEFNSTTAPAAGTVKGMSFHVRRSHLSRDQFRDYYETRHTPLVAGLFQVDRRYQRNYPAAATAHLPRGLADTPFDSVTQAWYDDIGAMKRFREAIGNPAVLSRLREDEENFLDGSKSILFQVDEIEQPIG